MKKLCLITLLALASCASQGPNLSQQPTDVRQYQADLAQCQDWAKPTRNEWAQRCQANGDMAMVATLIAAVSDKDPRDNDAQRQSMPNDTGYRLNMCLKAKGYKINVPGENPSIRTASLKD